MIRILLLIMLGAIALSLSYFTLKSIPMVTKMVTVGAGLAAALIAVMLQGNNPFYMPFLALVGVALIASLIYSKILEKQKMERINQSAERKARRTIENSLNKSTKDIKVNSFAMQSVESGREEQRVGQ